MEIWRWRGRDWELGSGRVRELARAQRGNRERGSGKGQAAAAESAAHCLCNCLLASRLSNALTAARRRRGRAALLHEGRGDWLEVDGMLLPYAPPSPPASAVWSLRSRVERLGSRD